MDRKEWEKKKLSSVDNSPAKMWKSVKGMIGWANTGPPTNLFHEGKGGRGLTNERLQTDYVITGPMRGLEKKSHL